MRWWGDDGRKGMEMNGSSVLDFNAGPNLTCMWGGMILVNRGEVSINSIWFVGSLDLKIKTREQNQIKSV